MALLFTRYSSSLRASMRASKDSDDFPLGEEDDGVGAHQHVLVLGSCNQLLSGPARVREHRGHGRLLCATGGTGFFHHRTGDDGFCLILGFLLFCRYFVCFLFFFHASLFASILLQLFLRRKLSCWLPGTWAAPPGKEPAKLDPRRVEYARKGHLALPHS